ncbi:S8 family serine peptidase [Paenibacillus sp. S-38]|uniref:S8 family serine peptidase n=1 Tax=Paenibacillus sp. S-38 TaxID=3416710 RepID=UPI003CEB047C
MTQSTIKRKVPAMLSACLLASLILPQPSYLEHSTALVANASASELPVVSPSLMSAAKKGKDKRIIVTFKKKADKTVLQKAKGKIKREHKHLPVIAATVTDTELEAMKKNPLIQSIEEDIQLKAEEQVQDWGATVSGATYAWSSGFTGQGVKVGVLDSGISLNHSDLSVAGGASFVDYTTSYDDDYGHGTTVAGVIGAKNNGIGMVGVAPDASLYALKALDSKGVGYLSDVIAGIDWAIQNQLDVLNMSLSTTVDSPALHQAVDQANAKGMLIVAAAGNNGNAQGSGDTVLYPAKYDSVIAVGSVDKENNRAAFSATGSALEVMAPGVNVYSTTLSNGYKYANGTSISSAFIAGQLSLLKQSSPGADQAALRAKLIESAKDLGTAGKDMLYGHGLVQYGWVNGNEQPADPDPTVNGDVYGSVTEDVYSVTGNVYAYAAATGPVVWWKSGDLGPTDYTSFFPDLSNAKSITVDWYDSYSTDYHTYYALYENNTVRSVKIDKDGYISREDLTFEFPNLENSKSIAVDSVQGGVSYFVLSSKDNTNSVRLLKNNSNTDVTAKFPSLVGAKAIAVKNVNYPTAQYYVLYNNNTIVTRNNSGVDNDVTIEFPNVTSQTDSIVVDRTHSGAVTYYTAVLNLLPKIQVNTVNQNVIKGTSTNLITITGTVQDADMDTLTVKASVNGVEKSAVISNARDAQPWSLTWNADTDNIPVGTYNNIRVSVTDGVWGSDSKLYKGMINVSQLPGAPTNLTAMRPNFSVASTTTPTLRWTFNDPDADDGQSAFDLYLYNSAGTAVHTTGWKSSTNTAYTVPADILQRGSTYSWKVRTKDSKGVISPMSGSNSFKVNALPVAAVTSYTEGQTLTVNTPKLTWNFSDADSQTQAAYQVWASKDNWATIGYSSGIVKGDVKEHTTKALSGGTWTFKVVTFDGLEWSQPVYRKLVIPAGAQDPASPTYNPVQTQYQYDARGNIISKQTNP